MPDALTAQESPSARTRDVPWGLFFALGLMALLIPWKQVFNGALPTGGDIGGHVWYPQEFAKALPFLHSMSADWYSGIPVGFFYFPVPALITNLFSIVMPYSAAFKLTMVTGLMLLPVGCWRLARSLSPVRLVATLAALAGVGMELERFYTIFGGNLASVSAGMFAFQIGFALALLAAADLADAVTNGRHRVRFVLLAAAACCAHVLAAPLFAVLALAVLLFAAPLSQWRNRRRALLPLVAVGLVCAAWWIPFLAYSSYATDMGYEPLRDLRWLLPIGMHYPDSATSPTWHWWGIGVFALAGALIALKDRFARVVLTLGAASAVLFVVTPRAAVWNVRWLPGYYLSCWLLAAVAIASLTPRLVPTAPWRRGVTVGASCFAAFLVLFPTLWASGLGIPQMPKAKHEHTSWLAWDFKGYQGSAAWPEYRDAMLMFKDLGERDGCGQVAWEYDPDQNRYGSTMAMQLIPYWTNGCMTSIEGVFFEASATTPFYFVAGPWFQNAASKTVRGLPYPIGLNMDKAMKALRALGSRFYATYNDATYNAARDAGLREVASSLHWHVFEVPNASLVTAESSVPQAVPWVTDTYVERFADRPDSTIADWDPSRYGLEPGSPLDDPGITNIETSDSTVSFDVANTGTPVLVHRSFFPGWSAQGADVYRASANMLLVVPTSNHVTVTWHRPPLVYGGYALALLGFGLSALLWVFDRRGKRDAGSLDPARSEAVDEPFAVGEGEGDVANAASASLVGTISLQPGASTPVRDDPAPFDGSAETGGVR